MVKGVKIIKKGDNIIWLLLDRVFFGLPKHIMLGCCYVVPSNSSHMAYIDRNLLDVIPEEMAMFKDRYDCDFMYCGDFNGRTGSEPDIILNDDDNSYTPLPDDYIPDANDLPVRYNRDTVVNTSGRRVLDFCKTCDVKIVNGRIGDQNNSKNFTCYANSGQSTVDYLIASPYLFTVITWFSVYPMSQFSDHCLLSFELKVKLTNNDLNRNNTCFKKMMWNNDCTNDYKTALGNDECLSMFNDMTNVINSGNTDESSVNQAVDFCVKAIRTAADPLFTKTIYSNNPNSNQFRNEPVWADNDWKSKKRNFYKSRDKFHSVPTDDNRNNMTDARRDYKHASFNCRKRYEVKNTNALYHAKLNNVKQYWRMLSGAKNIHETKVTIDQFFDHFVSLSNPSDELYRVDDDVMQEFEDIMQNDIQNIAHELNVPIEIEELQKSIKELKNNKSGGIDVIVNECFKNGQDILNPYLLRLFNYVFDCGIFPSSWSDGLLVPLHKKGDISTPGNYRGITLLSVLGKLFTRIINNRLDQWAEMYDIYIEAQYGFRKGRSTTDCIFVLHNVINSYIENGNKLYTFFIDYSKAFDYIVRENLWYKLLKIGINGKVMSIIMAMYTNVKSKVFLKGESSSNFECKLGVRQGECLSPFLFAMYVNDMESKLAERNDGISIDDIRLLLLFYADDCVLFSETPEGLQSLIDDLQSYCSKWKLSINTDKSKIIVFKKGNHPIREIWHYGDIILTTCNKMKYLGNMFASNGSFYQTQLTLSEQAGKAVFSLYRRINASFRNVKPLFMMDLFDKFIEPILSYGCEVWGFHPAKDIEKIHLRFCKNVLRVRRNTQDECVYGELGRMPLQIKRYVRIVKYWLNIIMGKKSYLVNYCYVASLKQLDVNSQPSWARNVRQLLCSHGFGEAWYNQGVGNIEAFITVFKFTLNDVYKQNWNAVVNNSPKCRFYKEIKPFHQPSEYLSIVVPQSHRTAMTRLLVSSHSLRIETGRWTRPVTPRSDRRCATCNQIEDEYHLLLKCPRYSQSRNKLIPKYYWQRPSMFKAVQLLQCNDPKIVKGVAKFIHEAFILQQSP